MTAVSCDEKLVVFVCLFSAVYAGLADTQYFSYKNLRRETLTSTTSAVAQ